MKKTAKNVSQAFKDVASFDQYLKGKENKNTKTINKTFKEAFGYDIILFEEGGFELRGERFSHMPL